MYILRPLFHLYVLERKFLISENGSFIKNQIKWAISSSMVCKEVCSWPGESAWPHLTEGADEGGQNVWVQESSCWTWSSPSSPSVGTSWSGCWKAAPPCERDRSQLSVWPILSANLKRSQNHLHHEKTLISNQNRLLCSKRDKIVKENK